MKDVTMILSRLESGEASGEDLLTAVYDELRQLAQAKMARERKGHTLQATALVHEAWMSLEAGSPGAAEHWENRRHFFGAAAEAMRRILVDHARKRQTSKRGGGIANVELDEAVIEVKVPPDELLALHEVLAELEHEDPQVAELVKLRYFIGLSMQEAADALGLKKRTAEGVWEYGRAWLSRRLRESP
jgi:RNA polymerase sigma factor (TIGR02999 family)